MEFIRSFFAGAKARYLLALTLLVLSVLLLLPVALKYYVLYAIEDAGLGKADIVDIDVNLFAGTFELESLQLDQDGEVTLVLGRVFLNYGWFGLGLTELEVEEITLEDSRLLIHEEQGVWYVIVPVNAADEPQQLESIDVEEQGIKLPKILAQKINLNNVQLDVRSQLVNGTFQVKSFDLKRLSSFTEEPAFLKLDSTWNGARIEFDWTAQIIKDIPRLEGDIRISDFQFSELLPMLGEPFSRLEGSADIALKVKAKRTPEIGLSVGGEGTVDINQVLVAYQQFEARVDSINWQGNAALDVDNPTLSLQHEGDISVEKIKLDAPKAQLALMALERLKLSGVKLDSLEKITLDALGLNQLHLLRLPEAEQADLRTAELRVDKIAFTDQRRLEIEAITVSDGQYHIVVDKKGALQIQSVLGQLAPSTQNSEDEVSEAQEPQVQADPENDFSIALGSFQVKGDSYIAFEDHQFDPQVKARFAIENLSLQQLDQQLPDQKTLVKLKGSLDEFSTVSLDGWSKPFLQHKNSSFTGSLKAIELPPFSAYVETATGYQINSGQLDHDFTLDIEREVLDMQNQVKLKSFELKEMDAEKTESTSKSMGVSMGLGLDLMRDSEGNIELDVPIKGQLDDPDLHLDTVISQAMGKAITKGSISFLKYAIQPYGAIVLAGEQLNKQMNSLDLQPLIFQPADDVLPVQSNDYLDKLVAVMAKRPGISLKLCGVASNGEEVLMTEQGIDFDEKSLKQLAKTRSVAVKRYFVDNGIESGRLALCKAQIHDKHLGGVRMSL